MTCDTDRGWHAIHPVADLIDAPSFFINGDARVAAMNHCARRFMQQRRGLGLSDGRLVADWPMETAKLRTLLKSSLNGARSQLLPLTRQHDHRPILLRLVRLESRLAQACLLVTDPGAKRPIDPETLAIWFGLTRREAEIAARLGRGSSVDELVQEFGIARGTIGTHLKHIYLKLDVNSQAQLADIVARLPEATTPLSD